MDVGHHEFNFFGQSVEIAFKNKVDKFSIERMILEIMGKVSNIYDFARVKLIFECKNGYVKGDSVIIAGRNQFNIESKIDNEINSGKLIISIITRKTINGNSSENLLDIINDIKGNIEKS
ncbi:MAG: hypothetical protein QW563_05615 [Candidatus Methanomethylicia archaeon]